MLITEYVLPAAVQLECKKVAGFFRPEKQMNPPVANVAITDLDLVLKAHTAPMLIRPNQFGASMSQVSTVAVPLIWLRTQPALVSDIYETELAYFRRTHDVPAADLVRTWTSRLQMTVDRLRCVSAAFPDHVGLAELRDEAMLLEATSVLLEAAKRR